MILFINNFIEIKKRLNYSKRQSRYTNTWRPVQANTGNYQLSK